MLQPIRFTGVSNFLVYSPIWMVARVRDESQTIHIWIWFFSDLGKDAPLASVQSVVNITINTDHYINVPGLWLCRQKASIDKNFAWN